MFNINVTMGSAINILVKGKNIKFKLNNTRTASRLETVLPLEANVQKWGNEIYFSIPLEHQLEQGREILKARRILPSGLPGRPFVYFLAKHRRAQIKDPGRPAR
ncbi:MAG: cyclophilin-like family protein [Actinomycetota bacterium]|nr:cyclophilin-like family protein [Actinomycetota bacterium]